MSEKLFQSQCFNLVSANTENLTSSLYLCSPLSLHSSSVRLVLFLEHISPSLPGLSINFRGEGILNSMCPQKKRAWQKLCHDFRSGLGSHVKSFSPSLPVTKAHRPARLKGRGCGHHLLLAEWEI